MTALRIDPQNPAPIWSQIEEGLRRLVASAALKPGTAVPSVRDLAKELKVNPATVAKAYQRLTEVGVLEVRRGNGTYVAGTPPPMNRSERSKILREAATRYASLAATLGVEEEEAAGALAAVWKKEGRP